MAWPESTDGMQQSTEERLIAALIKSQEQHVEANVDGHKGTQKKVSELGDRFEKSVNRWASIVTLCLLIVAGLVGLRLVLPDGTTIEPTAAAAAADVE